MGRSMNANSFSPQNSGIFGYINYLVEKDRKFILDTLINGKWLTRGSGSKHNAKKADINLPFPE